MTALTLLGLVVADHNDHHHGWWGGDWMWLGGTLMMVAFLVAIGVVVWAIARGPLRRSEADPTSRAREILAERYARGEISGDEYRERLGELR